MNDTSSLSSNGAPPVRKKRSIALPIMGAIIVLALVGFFASRAGLDKALVKQQLDAFIEQMQEKSRAQGRDLTMTYGELEVTGSFAAKHVLIHNPVVLVKPLVREAPKPGEKPTVDALRITTPTLAIYPQSADLKALRIEAAAPIDFASEDAPAQSLLSIKSATPLALTITRRTANDVPHTDLAFQAPS